MSSIPAQPHTFVEIDHEIFSMFILLLLNQEGLMSVTSESMCISLPRESVVRFNDYPDMTIAVDWDVKPQTFLTLPFRPKRLVIHLFRFFLECGVGRMLGLMTIPT